MHVSYIIFQTLPYLSKFPCLSHHYPTAGAKASFMATPGTKRKKSSGGGPAAKKARLEDEDRKFFADGFDENCIGDEDDQEYLNGLTEVRLCYSITCLVPLLVRCGRVVAPRADNTGLPGSLPISFWLPQVEREQVLAKRRDARDDDLDM